MRTYNRDLDKVGRGKAEKQTKKIFFQYFYPKKNGKSLNCFDFGGSQVIKWTFDLPKRISSTNLYM